MMSVIGPVQSRYREAVHVLDPVVDRVERNDRLGCFVDRLHRLVDDFYDSTHLGQFPIDLVDLRPC